MSRSWALLVYRTFSPYIHWQKVLGTILWQSKWQRTLNQLLHPWWWIFSNTDVLSPPFYLFKSCNHYLIVNGFSKHNTVWFDADTPERYRYFNDWLDNYIHNNNIDEVLQLYVNIKRKYVKEDDNNIYTTDSNVKNGGHKQLVVQEFTYTKNELENFEQKFWHEYRNLSYDGPHRWWSSFVINVNVEDKSVW